MPYSLLNTTSTICELKFARDCRMVVHFKDKDPETGQKTKSIPLDKQTASDKISSFVHKKTGRKRSTDIKKIELFWDHEVLEVILDSRSSNSFNRPFYRYGGHIELIRFKEYYRMPRGSEHNSSVFSSAFRDIFS